MNYAKNSKMLTGTTSTWEPCRHEGHFFTVKFWIFKKKFLWCNKCKQAIPRNLAELQKEIVAETMAELDKSGKVKWKK